ncbi:YpiF family protein [Planococcus sp. MERTA32b]|nr:YpiF family protein [Planococcus sp. MER TA 32b]
MHFIGRDMDQYLSQKDYVDTAVVPLVQLDLSEAGLKSSAGASEYLQSLTTLLEKQFKGRILLFPPMAYTKNADRSRLSKEISEELEKAGFKHVFYMTTDAEWRSIDELQNVLWLPAIPTEHMDRNFKQSVMEDQLRQVLPLFLKEWS